jgi:hypothetical protein
MNREEWLTLAAQRIAGWLAEAGHPCGAYRVACGFPSRGGTSAKQRRIGECWEAGASAGNVAEVFVSPVLAQTVDKDGGGVLPVLAHEMVHVATPGAKHGKAFKRAALALGLAGKMTSTHAGDALVARLNALAAELGAYPHDAITPKARGTVGSRLLLVSCGCGIKVRASAKAAEEMAALGWACGTCGEGVRLNDA